MLNVRLTFFQPVLPNHLFFKQHNVLKLMRQHVVYRSGINMSPVNGNVSPFPTYREYQRGKGKFWKKLWT